MLLFASTFEGFGMPIVEAQRIGRCVVTSNISSMPEVAGNGACFVDPFSVNSIREGLLKVIADSKFRLELIENGLINCRRFTEEKIAEAFYHVYDKVCMNAEI